LDRIDIQIEVTPVPFDDLTSKAESEKSESIRERVKNARQIQQERYASLNGIHSNAMMPPNMIRELCQLDTPSENLLKTAMNRLKLSARAYDRILKVARTIADLDGKPNINHVHISEAIGYRNLDRENWGGN
jgi:magnesium chelatase family protein